MGNKQACIDECVRIHTDAAKACCAVAPYNPIAFAGCMLLAGGSLTACLGLCGAILVKVENDMRDSRYACELYLSDIKYNYPPIYGTNPIDTLVLSLELAKIHLQGLIVAGYTISELESRKFWKLEKGKSLSERINELKNNKDISQDYKDKILMIMKENFGKIPVKNVEVVENSAFNTLATKNFSGLSIQENDRIFKGEGFVSISMSEKIKISAKPIVTPNGCEEIYAAAMSACYTIA
ncbi:23353_t:CDS:2 [Racocetra persica]|uniref:23353_t:CDS:1 n=1 Tax=Racocetra persica TaxID=160502 RepID=A0ACA9MED2_9GLOM|nr:23353_t:CDS:2 [Racocetra persica]